MNPKNHRILRWFFSYIYDQLAKFFEKVSKRYDSSQAKYVISKNLGEDLFKIFEEKFILERTQEFVEYTVFQ